MHTNYKFFRLISTAHVSLFAVIVSLCLSFSFSFSRPLLCYMLKAYILLLFSLFFSILSILLPSLNDFFSCTFVDFLSCHPSSLVCSQVQATENHALCSTVNVSCTTGDPKSCTMFHRQCIMHYVPPSMHHALQETQNHALCSTVNVSCTMSHRQCQAAIDLFRSKTVHSVHMPVKQERLVHKNCRAVSLPDILEKIHI